MTILLFIVLCFGVGLFANKKFNRNLLIWSLIAFLFSPLFAILILLFLEYVYYTSPENFSRKIMDLYKLRKDNILSEDEYEFKKNILISSIRNDKKEEFLVKITPLVENNILTDEDIENIKRRLYGRVNKNS